MIRSLLKRVSNFVFTEVPKDIAACEFDCREVECLNKDFLTCSSRLHKAEACRDLPKEDVTLLNNKTN